jgi:hypothetical protein
VDGTIDETQAGILEEALPKIRLDRQITGSGLDQRIWPKGIPGISAVSKARSGIDYCGRAVAKSASRPEKCG